MYGAICFSGHTRRPVVASSPMRNPRQSITLTLAQLQAAGYTSGGDFAIGIPLPTDAVIIGTQIDVAQALASPSLITASATVFASAPPLQADLMTLGSYQSGGQQFYLSVKLVGDTMAALTAGNITATVFYIQAATPTYEMNQI